MKNNNTNLIVVLVVVAIGILLVLTPVFFIKYKQKVLQPAGELKPAEEITIPEYETEIEAPFLQVKDIMGDYVPMQNNLPYSGYERQKTREYLDLAGTWKKERQQVDHKLTLKKRTPEVITEVEEEGGGRHKVGYDDSGWEAKEIPSVENPPLDRYQDGVWYRREINIPADYKGKYLKLRFEGANYYADVWLNGKWLGSHEGGYTPFAFDVSGLVNYGSPNVIAVRVDNIPWLPMKPMSPEEENLNDRNIVPYKTCDWWNYGGLTRDVYIEALPPVNVVRADVQCELEDEDSAVVAVQAVLYNRSPRAQKVTLDTAIYDAEVTESNILSVYSKDLIKGRALASAEEAAFTLDAYEIKPLKFKLRLADIALWRPSNPQLYVVGVELKSSGKLIDENYSQFGIREVSLDNQNTKLLLNNEEIFLRGVAAHEVFAGTPGEDYQGIAGYVRDMRIMKQFNANFYRTAHYSNHPATYLMADRVGLLVWEEIPVFWFGSDEFDLQRTERKIAKNMWLEMIYRDYNSPSIIFWSTCNECGAQKERSLFIKDLYDDAYKVDGSRLVVQSASGNDTDDATHNECDLIGITSYYGIFYGKDYYEDTQTALEELHENFPNKPILLTEFGIWSEQDFSNAPTQVEVAMDTFEAASEKPYVCGTTWWCAFNWHTMITEPQTMGLITWDRKIRKPVYFILQRLYGRYLGDMEVALSGPQKGEPVRGRADFNYQITDAGELSFIEVYLDDMLYKKPGTGKLNNTISLDTKDLTEGDHEVLVRVEAKNGLTISKKLGFFVDNIDEYPVINVNLKDGDEVFDYGILTAEVKDDRGINEVLYRRPDGTYEPMDERGFGWYVHYIDASEIAGGETFKAGVKAVDSGGNEKEQIITLTTDKEEPISVNLPYNNDWVSYEENARDADDFYNFPAEFLPMSNTYYIHNGQENIAFKFPDKEDGRYNSVECAGQVLRVPSGKYKKIYILGVMHNGNEMHQLKLNYRGEPSVEAPMPFSDWWMGNNNFGEEVGFYFPYHHELGAKKKPPVAIYVQEVEVNPNKVLESISVPVNPKVHIFAITMVK